jgi:hypothetical protein
VASWEAALRRWAEAGLVDRATEERIRAWEATRPNSGGIRWPAWLALGLGGVMVGAGILLFVAAHWDGLSPVQRFALVLAMVGGLHLAGVAATTRSSGLAATLHACGTVALGAGIFLTGQIFNLREHWPGGVLLWAAGAWLGWALLRQWPQGALAAVLTPAWLAGEWSVAPAHGRPGVLGVGLVLLSLAYLAAEPGAGPILVARSLRRALVWIGGLALIPAAIYLLAGEWSWYRSESPEYWTRMPAWAMAVGLPVAAAAVLRGRAAVFMLPAAVWVALGPVLAHQGGVAPYLWAAALAVLVIIWGVVDRRSERINLGMAGFALAVTVFYFSDVMDRLGRSASLIGLGLLFLGGGYLLERTRRRLVDRAREPAR